MKQLNLVLVLIPAIIAGAIPAAPTSSGGSSLASFTIRSSAPAASFAGPAPVWRQCVGCDTCGEGAHFVFDTPLGIRYVAPGDNHTDCWQTGSCDTWHPTGCGGFAAAIPDLNLLWTRLGSGIPASDLVGLIRAKPDIITFNAKRNAIQVRGCNGTLLAHVPLSAVDGRVLQSLLVP